MKFYTKNKDLAKDLIQDKIYWLWIDDHDPQIVQAYSNPHSGHVYYIELAQEEECHIKEKERAILFGPIEAPNPGDRFNTEEEPREPRDETEERMTLNEAVSRLIKAQKFINEVKKFL